MPELQLFKQALEQASEAVVITDADLENGPHIIFVNAAFEKMTGYTRDEVIGRTPRILQGPKTKRHILVKLKQALKAGENFEGESVNYRKNGSTYDVRWRINPVRTNGSKQPTYFIAFQRDVTAENERNKLMQLLATAVNDTADQVLITDKKGKIVYVNKAFENLTGFKGDEVIGRTPAVLKSGEHDVRFYQHLWETIQNGSVFKQTFTDRKKDGNLYQVEQTITPVFDEDGSISHFVSTGKDVTQRCRLEQRLKMMAITDGLTGLGNRRHFEKQLQYELDRARRYNHPLSLILFDIDYFKEINDRFGHEEGDRVLKLLATEINSRLRTPDLFFRWGGEEFAIIVVETPLSGAVKFAEQLREMISKIEFFPDLTVTASFGVVEACELETRQELFKRADDALYEAKNSGRNSVAVK